MTTDFNINRPVGTGHSRANDVIRLRKALNETGHGSSPPEPSGVYDPSVQASIESFQRDFGLKTDAIVEPGGPTEKTIKLALAARRRDGAAGQAQLRGGFKVLQGAGITFHTDPRGDSRSGAFRNADGALVSSQQMDAVLDAAGRRGEIKTAMMPARLINRKPGQDILEGGGGGVATGAVAAGAVLGGLFQRLFGDDAKRQSPKPRPPQPRPDQTGRGQQPEAAGRTVPAGNIPKGPAPFPAEPPPDPDRDKEPIKVEERVPQILKGREIVEAKPDILIFPDFSDRFNEWLIIERRGNEKTRAHLEEVRDYFVDKYPELEHVAGGRERTGDKVTEKPEMHIPNPAKDFDKLLGIKIDGRRGGKFVDLTFRNKKTGKLLHIQSVDVDRNGKPTQRELDNAETIRKRTGDQVLLIPKPHQLKPRNK